AQGVAIFLGTKRSENSQDQGPPPQLQPHSFNNIRLYGHLVFHIVFGTQYVAHRLRRDKWNLREMRGAASHEQNVLYFRPAASWATTHRQPIPIPALAALAPPALAQNSGKPANHPWEGDQKLIDATRAEVRTGGILAVKTHLPDLEHALAGAKDAYALAEKGD